MPSGDLSLPTGLLRQRPPAYSAIKIDGRRAYARARAGEAVLVPERDVHVYRFTETWREADRRGFEIDAVGHLHPLARRRPRRRVLRGAAPHANRAVRGVRRRRGDGAARRRPARSCPRSRWSPTPPGPRSTAVPADRGGPVRLLSPGGDLIAIAEPREGGVLKPVVGCAIASRRAIIGERREKAPVASREHLRGRRPSTRRRPRPRRFAPTDTTVDLVADLRTRSATRRAARRGRISGACSLLRDGPGDPCACPALGRASRTQESVLRMTIS